MSNIIDNRYNVDGRSNIKLVNKQLLATWPWSPVLYLLTWLLDIFSLIEEVCTKR